MAIKWKLQTRGNFIERKYMNVERGKGKYRLRMGRLWICNWRKLNFREQYGEDFWRERDICIWESFRNIGNLEKKKREIQFYVDLKDVEEEENLKEMAECLEMAPFMVIQFSVEISFVRNFRKRKVLT